MNTRQRFPHGGPANEGQEKSSKPKVLYTSINQEVTIKDEAATLLDISMENQIPHLHECGGNGRCTTCRVRIIEGHRNLSSPTAIEKNTSHLRRWDPSIRLACQCYVKGDVEVQRLVWSIAIMDSRFLILSIGNI